LDLIIFSYILPTSDIPRGDFGFVLDASGGGTINFKGNTSQDQLSTSNNSTSIDSTEGTGIICYGSGC